MKFHYTTVSTFNTCPQSEEDKLFEQLKSSWN